MKPNILTIFATLLFVQICAAKVVEDPYFECRTSAVLNVTKIELNDNETKLYLRCTYIPNWWITIDDDTTIKNSNGDETYTITSLEGGELNEKLFTPKCGYQDLVLHFDAIDKGITEIDFGIDDEDWKIYNIDLTGEKVDTWDSLLPEELHGNWSDVTGIDGWCYGFYENCAIVDNLFWEYSAVKRFNDGYVINLKSSTAIKRLYVKKEGERLAIGESADPKSLYSTERPHFNSRGQSTSEIDPLKSGKMVLNGYIEGYSPLSGLKTGLLYYNNDFTGESLQSLIIVDEQGRFMTTIDDLPNVQECFMRLGDYYMSLIITPNDTIALYLNYEKMLQKRLTNDFSIAANTLVMGGQDRLNYEMFDLANYSVISRSKTKKINGMQKELTLAGFRDTITSMYSVDSIRLERRLGKENLSPASKKIARNMLISRYYGQLMVNGFMATRGNIVTTECDGLKCQRSGIDFPDGYFDMIKRIYVDDKTALMLSDFSAFMNSYQFSQFFIIYVPKDDETPMEKAFEAQIKGRVAKGKELWGDDGDFITQMTIATDLGIMLYSFDLDESKAKRCMELALEYISEPSIRKAITKYYNQKYEVVISKNVDSKPIPEGVGKEIMERLLAPHKGKYVMVDFWAATCGPCISGIANSHDIRNKLADRDVVFMFITDNRNTSADGYNKYMTPTVGDKHHVSADEWNKLASLFNINGVPRYILFDKDGQVIDDHFAGWNAIESKLNELENCINR